MKVIDEKEKEIEIRNEYWPLAEDLFVKWHLFPNKNNEIYVKDVEDVAPELSAWGIPWKRTKWDF